MATKEDRATRTSNPKLLDAMVAKDLNPRSLAKAAGVHHNTIYGLLKGRRCYFDTAAAISRELDVPMSELDLM